MQAEAKAFLVVGLLALAGLGVWIGGGNDSGGRHETTTAPAVPTAERFDETAPVSDECADTMERVMREKLGMQEELTKALADKDRGALERLDARIETLNRETLTACD
jgi:hypothetical protein